MEGPVLDAALGLRLRRRRRGRRLARRLRPLPPLRLQRPQLVPGGPPSGKGLREMGGALTGGVFNPNGNFQLDDFFTSRRGLFVADWTDVNKTSQIL